VFEDNSDAEFSIRYAFDVFRNPPVLGEVMELLVRPFTFIWILRHVLSLIARLDSDLQAWDSSKDRHIG